MAPVWILLVPTKVYHWFWAKGNRSQDHNLRDERVCPPNSLGPPVSSFDNQDYYSLQTLTHAAGVGADQYWIWEETQTVGGVTVLGRVAVPTEFEADVQPRALPIPVPFIPPAPNL